MVDSAAALLDERLRPPRQGDDDEGRALLLDAPAPNRWPSLLALGEALFGRLDWWPRTAAGRGQLDHRRPGRRAARDVAGRPAQRPSRFADAGITLLRTTGGQAPEIWCRCDGGPHGYLSIAAHAHADALSVEVRYGGVDVLADPGTYCYHGEPDVAFVLPLDDRAQHRRARRAEPVQRGRPLPLAAACQRPGDRRPRRRRGRQLDRGGGGGGGGGGGD